jgi:hypothetical protein
VEAASSDQLGPAKAAAFNVQHVLVRMAVAFNVQRDQEKVAVERNAQVVPMAVVDSAPIVRAVPAKAEAGLNDQD